MPSLTSYSRKVTSSSLKMPYVTKALELELVTKSVLIFMEIPLSLRYHGSRDRLTVRY